MWQNLALNWVSWHSGFNHYITSPHLNRKDRAGKKTIFGKKERGSLQGRVPFLLSPIFLFSGHQHDQTSWKNMHSCLSNLFPFCPSLVITRGQMEILTSHQIPENENACGKSAPSLWLHPCASFACPPGLHNLLIPWCPTVREVAHLCFQQILPMVWCGMVTSVCLISLLPD